MSELRFAPTRGTGAILTAVTLLSLNGLPDSNPRTNAQVAAEQATATQEAIEARERTAREAIAARFASCAVTRVHSDPENPVRIKYADNSKRIPLDISVRVGGPTRATQEAMREYNENDRVYFHEPEIQSSILSNGKLGFGMMAPNNRGRYGSAFDGDQVEATGHFTPHADYTDGTEAGVYVIQEAMSDHIDPTTNEVQTVTTKGQTYCGTLVVKNGVWVAETAHPTVLPDTLVTTTD